MTVDGFVDALFRVRMPSVFNPYTDICAVYDRPDASERRRRNLECYLRALVETDVDTIWIARDLGYRGGRRTGIPLTDEAHLEQMARVMGGISLEKATRGPAIRERTAAVVWKVITQIEQPVALWNVFPFHPHHIDRPLSNRRHTSEERAAVSLFLPALVELLKPRRLIAIGRDAEQAVDNMDVQVVGVRHPSFGGQKEFASSLLSMYGRT